MTFIGNVKVERTGLKLSQRKLARVTNIEYTTPNHWEIECSVLSRLTSKSFLEFFQTKGIEVPAEVLAESELA